MTRCVIALGLLALVTGCGSGSSRPESEIERGRAAVAAALDAWKANEPPSKLKSLPDPVEFSDELRKTHALTDYTLGKVEDSGKDVVHYEATLSLKDKKGKQTTLKVVFAVVLKSPVVVSRDPYY